MAYQNVGTPRFYVDLVSYLQSMKVDINITNDNQIDVGEDYRGLLGLDPVNQVELTNSIIINWDEDNPKKENDFANLINPKQTYVAYLNHNVDENEPMGYLNNPTNYSETISNPVSVLNFDLFSGSQEFLNNNVVKKGSTILTGNTESWITDEDVENPSFNMVRFEVSPNLVYPFSPPNLGSLSFGSYFDMPVSVDLNLSLDIEFDGYDSATTLGGSTLTNVRYSGSPYWYDNNANKRVPFAVGDSSGFAKRNGRRTWSMDFSYISDKDLFASNYMDTHYTETTDDYNSEDLGTINSETNQLYYNINTDDSFIAQVLNRVGNGERFIFQPDNTNNNPDQFAICVLDQNSLKIDQVAYKVYNISLKIMEVW